MTRRKLTAAAFQSIDGVIQGGGNPDEDRSGGFTLGGWTVPLTDDSANAWMDKLYNEPEYDLLLAKRTYDIFSAYWPYHLDDPIGAKFERINKYVLTHSSELLTWDHSYKLSGDTADAVRALKNTDGRDLLIQGSSTIYQPLLAAGLIDRLVLMTFPVVLGKGKKIFQGSATPGALKLVEHFVSGAGVVFATYEPDGEVKTGTFETQAPSAAELKRRANWPK
ncbi:MAG: dihydrofolate reductase family protein [Steroidobacteraceae bacterium]|nr:dihydrofolate reductase family protein [Steroidobacteraceae bacterium]